MVLSLSDLKTEVHNDWCPGCGDFGILNAIQIALLEMKVELHRVAIFSGIGCSGKTPHFIKTYGIHTLHGRVLPYAIGAKLANPSLEVVAVGGDGDGLGIGAGHFVNSARRNLDMTYIIHDNGVYGLTKGQASPTLELNLKTKSLPKPNINEAIDPIALALSVGCTFIARGYAYDVRHLKELIKRGINHRGFAFIDVLQPCPTYNDIQTKEWYSGEDNLDPSTKKPIPRVYRLEDTGYDPKPRSSSRKEIDIKRMEALVKSSMFNGRIPIGAFYIDNYTSTYDERISTRIPDYRDNPPMKQMISTPDGTSVTSLKKLYDELRVTPNT